MSLMGMFLPLNYVYHFADPVKDRPLFPVRHILLKIFVTCSVVFVLDSRIWMNLSNADLIFLANMISAGEPVEGVFGFGVFGLRYTCRNYCKALSVGAPCPFLRALFSMSENLSV